MFISGGENEENVPIDINLKINLKDGKLTKLDPLKSPRLWHGMIFVPKNYVFIIGGITNLDVEVLNTETGEIKIDSTLNEVH